MRNKELYFEIGPQKLEDVKTAYIKGWINLSEMEKEVERFI